MSTAFSFPTGDAGKIDASNIPYTPTNPGDWSPVPTTVQGADDQLASRVKALESGATNAPTYYKGSVGTTNATPANAITSTYSIPSNKEALIEAWVEVKKTDLSQSAAWHFIGVFRNNAGTVTQDGDTDYLDSPPQLQSAAWGGGIPAFVISGTSINVQVTGVAATNYTWSARMAVHEN